MKNLLIIHFLFAAFSVNVLAKPNLAPLLDLNERASLALDESKPPFENLSQRIASWSEQKEGPGCYDVVKDLKNIKAPDLGPSNAEANQVFLEILTSLKKDLEDCRKKWVGASGCAAPVNRLISVFEGCLAKEDLAPEGIYAPAVVQPISSSPDPYKNLMEQIRKNQAAKASSKNLVAQFIKAQDPRNWVGQLAALALGSSADQGAGSLLIFSDDTEASSNNVAVTQASIFALYQKAGPILITGALLSNIFGDTTRHAQGIQEILKIFHEQFDARAWTIKKLDDDDRFFLMIPSRNPTSDALGLNIDSPTLETSNKNSLTTYFGDKGEKFRESRPDFSSALVTVLDKLNPKKPMIILWIGHGGLGHSIAGVSIVEKKGQRSDFQTVLDRWAQRVPPKFVVIVSCNAAGANSQKVYGELKSKSGTRTYPFPIVTQATGDAPVYGGKIQYSKGEQVFWMRDEGSLTSEIDYSAFLKETKKELVDFASAVRHVIPLTAREAGFAGEIGGIPQMRPANSPGWFPLQIYDGAVVRLTNTMSLTKKDPLVVKQYKVGLLSWQAPKAILLDTMSEIKFPLVVEKSIKKIPPFISTTAGVSAHVIDSLEANVDVEKLIYRDLVGEISYGARKIFWFKKIKGSKGRELRNLIIDTKDGQLVVYVTIGGASITLGGAEGLSEQQYVKFYDKLVNEIRTADSRS